MVRLDRIPRSEFDQRDGTRRIPDTRRAPLEDLRFGIGEIVFRLFADFFEEPASLVVIKEARMEPRRRVRQPEGDRFGEFFGRSLRAPRNDNDTVYIRGRRIWGNRRKQLGMTEALARDGNNPRLNE